MPGTQNDSSIVFVAVVDIVTRKWGPKLRGQAQGNAIQTEDLNKRTMQVLASTLLALKTPRKDCTNTK